MSEGTATRAVVHKKSLVEKNYPLLTKTSAAPDSGSHCAIIFAVAGVTIFFHPTYRIFSAQTSSSLKTVPGLEQASLA
jgi:hypothetical protein